MVGFCIQVTLSSRAVLACPAFRPSVCTSKDCIQDTLSSRAVLGRVRRASKGILHTRAKIGWILFGGLVYLQAR